jgi:hypothetical protein
MTAWLKGFCPWKPQNYWPKRVRRDFAEMKVYIALVQNIWTSVWNPWQISLVSLRWP